MQRAAVLDRTIEKLEASVREFMETGICVVRDRYYRSREKDGLPSFTKGSQMRGFLRMVAKDLKRPFVLADVCQDEEKVRWVTLSIPRIKRLHNLISALLLVSSEHYGNRWRIPDNVPVARVDQGNAWVFHFQKEGIEIFDNFLNQCRTDPIFRICLKA